MNGLRQMGYMQQQDYLDHIQWVLDSNKDNYQGIRIRCITTLINKEWRNCVFEIHGLPKNQKINKAENRTYKNVRLIEKWIETKDLIEFLGFLKEKKLSIDGIDVFFGQNQNPENISFANYYPSENECSSFPGFVYKNSETAYVWVEDPLIEPGLPTFPNLWDAIFDWMTVRGLDRNPTIFQANTAKIHSVVIFLPECRARISRVKTTKKSINIKLDGVLIKSLKAKCVLRVANNLLQIEKRITKNYFSVEIPKEGVYGFYFYLTDDTGRIYDFIEEGDSGRPFSNRGILNKMSAPSGVKNLVKNAHLLGEGETLEFKPFILPEHEKINELVRSIIAFANLRGGTILMGIDKLAIIVGIENELSKNPKKIKKELDTYIRKLRALINDSISKDMVVRFVPVKTGRKIVLAVEVEEGANKPYEHIQERKTYIRRGANNVFAAAEEILKISNDKKERGLIGEFF